MALLKPGDIFVGWDILPPDEKGAISEMYWRARPVVLRRSPWTGWLKPVKYQGVSTWGSREDLQRLIEDYWRPPTPPQVLDAEFLPWKQDALRG